MIDEVNESLEFVGSQGTFLASLTNAQVRQHTHHAEQLECGMRLLGAHVPALSRQFVVADEAAFLGASLRRLCLEHNANQTITFRGFDPLNIADPTNLLRIIALVKFASQDPLGASELRSAGTAHVVGMRQVGVHQLPRSRISRESPPQLLTNTIVEPLEEVARLGGLQQRLHLRVGIPPASVTGDMTQRDRERFLALTLIWDIPIQQTGTYVPRLSRILERNEIGSRPTEFLGQNTIKIDEALVPRAVEATRPAGDTGGELSTLSCLVLVRVDAGVVDEHDRIQQLNWLVMLVDLDRAKTNRLEADVDADPVANTLDIC